MVTASSRKVQFVDARDLYRRLVDGQAEAFEEFYRQHLEPLIRTVRRLVGDREVAEEIAQDAFRILLERLDTLDPEGNIKAWLFRVALNLAKNWLRRQSVDQRHSPVVLEIESSRRGADDRLQLQRAIDQLSLSHREIVLLVYEAGFSIEEAAAALDITPPAARQRLSRARAILRKLLNDSNDNQGKNEATS